MLKLTRADQTRAVSRAPDSTADALEDVRVDHGVTGGRKTMEAGRRCVPKKRAFQAMG